jgi:hypothetical protein
VAVKSLLAELHQQRSDPLVAKLREVVDHYRQMAAHDAATGEGNDVYKAQGVYYTTGKILEGLDSPPRVLK